VNRGWINTTLGQQVTLQRGFDITKEVMQPGSIPVISSGGINGYHNAAMARGPGVLLGRKGSVGNVHYVETDYWPHDTTLWVKDFHGNWPRFVYRFFAQFPISRYEASTANPSLNRNNLHPVKVFWPPVAEQQRIADILDRAEELRAKRRAALAKLDTLTQAIFTEMFGDPTTNPKGWSMRTIADVCEVKGGKRLPKGEEYSSTPTPFRYIRVTDLSAGVVDESALKYLKPEIQSKIARYIVNTGDVIISIAGSTGLVAPVPPSLDGANLTENAAKLTPRQQGVYDAGFLSAILQEPFAQNQIGSHVGQVTIGKLALFRIEKLRIPLPPLKLQKEYASRIAAVEQLRSAHRLSLAQLDALFASLQHRAFRGEL
jgi:type I restriction enzyme, S subunit